MSLLKSTIVISIFTLFSRISGFVRDVFFAKFLGTGYFADVFQIAYKLPNFFRNLFAEGVLYSSFVPIFSETLNNDGKDNKNIKYFSKNIFSILFYFLLIFTIIVEIFMPFVIKILANSFLKDTEKYLLTIKAARIMFPYLLLVSLTSLLAAILNSYGRFAITSIRPIILNLSFIFFCILSSVINMKITYILSIALLIGGLFEFIWLFYFTCKKGIILYPTLIKFDKLTNNFLKLFINGFLATSIIQLNSIIDFSFSSAFVGATSYIYFANRLTQLPLTLIGTAISTSILPVLSRKIVNKEEDRFLLQEDAIFYSLFLGIPCFIGLYFVADLLIPLLFQGGKFTVNDALELTKCVKILSGAIPCYIVAKIFQTIFFANKDTKTPLIASLISLISNIYFNIVFIKYYGYKGIILSTLISTFINIFILFLCLYKKHYIKFSKLILIKMLKLTYPLLFMIIIINICNKISIDINNKIYVFLKLSIMSIISGSVYLILSFLLKILDINIFFKKNAK